MDTLDIKTFKQMLLSGTNNLLNHKDHINALNVFPVPDGDTGTNMSLTFINGNKSANQDDSLDIAGVSKALSKGLLMGARGNSGVILSQIFRGFAQGLEELNEATVEDVANAFVRGSEVAYKAVMKPVEGTILTVSREGAAFAKDYVKENPDISMIEYFDVLVEASNKSLENTPELLPVLKEVGVVDSGGAGLLLIIEGFAAVLNGKKIERVDEEEADVTAQSTMESEEYGYCTEMILRLDDKGKMTFNEDKMKTSLVAHGDSLVLVQDEDLVKVHIHTLSPGTVLNMVQKYGEFVTLKIDNMQEQHDEIIHNELKLHPKEAKPYALVAVAAGDGLSDYFKELRVDVVISGGQTMNPSTEDFVAKIKDLNAENIIILPNNSNIILAAEQVKSVIEDKNIHVVPTKSIIQGISACINYNPEETVENNLDNMNAVLDYVKTGEVTYAIKDTLFEGKEIALGDYMGISNGKISASGSDLFETVKDLIQSMITEDDELLTLVVGQDTYQELVDQIVDFVEDEYDIEVETVVGNQPVYYFIIGLE
ncbi:MAG TPA: DAK2 domain-containing protein [Erysipelotrichaceae bacterium]|nr:DAK2 domain-containing protein [Erysipelotrichaceae bacterium]